MCEWVKGCEMDPTPWREAGVVGYQLPTLSLDTLTSMGLTKLTAKKTLREVDGLLASSSSSRPSAHRAGSRPATAATAVAAADGVPVTAGGGGSKAWIGYLVVVLAILSHLFWHPLAGTSTHHSLTCLCIIRSRRKALT